MKEYDKWQNFKITEEERKQLKKDAHEHNMNVSEYIRHLLLKEREVMQSGKQDNNTDRH